MLFRGLTFLFVFKDTGCQRKPSLSTNPPHRAIADASVRLDSFRPEALVQELFTAGLVASTQKVSRAGERCYISVRSLIEASPYPVSDHQLSKFVAFIYQEGLSAGTMESYLAALRHAQIALGLCDPVMVQMPQLQYVLWGAPRRLAGKVKRMRLPIAPEMLQGLRRT